MVNTHVLPDSRLHDDSLGSIMVDWDMPDGSKVRIEVVPIYCGNCGKLYGHVPKENTTFVFWLCRKCFEHHGAIAGTYAMPDDEFNQKVAFEMREKFHRDLTDLELFHLAEHGKLGTALENLVKDSPYLVPG